MRHLAAPRNRRRRESWRSWPIWTTPRSLIALALGTDLVAILLGGYAIATMDVTSRRLGEVVLLASLAVVFEETARRAARLRLRLSEDLKRDMVSVWAVSGAVALQPGYAVLLLTVVLTYVWFRQQRPAGEPFLRKGFNASVIIVSSLAAAWAVHRVAVGLDGFSWTVRGAFCVLAAIVVFATVNRALVTVALLLLAVRGKALLGSRDENLFEFATLCLGGLASFAMLHEPWVAALSLAPMIALQRGALVRELEVAAMTDAKTGLLNPLAWEQLAQREIARAHRESYALAVLIIDLDRFKLVNDRFGHLVGDAILKAVGRILRAETRDYDTIGRFGGEEFVAVLPETNEANAMRVAERIRAAIAASSVASLVPAVPADDGDLPMSASIGVACTGVDGDDLSELLYGADRALYYAKENGRNQVQRVRPAGPGEMSVLPTR